MAAIQINSPYSGRPVKIREQDIGRAVRDEEGRIFYVVRRSSGEGYYAAMTRKGSAREEAAYDAMAAKASVARAAGAAASARQIHDATGRRRSNLRGKLVIAALVGLVLGVLALWWQYGDAWQKSPAPPAEIPVDGPRPPASSPAADPDPAPPPAEPRGAVEPAPEHAEFADAAAGPAGDQPDVKLASIVNLMRQDAAAGMRHFETPAGLRVIVEREGVDDAGSARRARPSSLVHVSYRGTLLDGTVIDSSAQSGYDRFRLEPDALIAGLAMGIEGMAVGERRIIFVPPALAYGSRGVGELIPPDAPLRYEVELLDVQ